MKKRILIFKIGAIGDVLMTTPLVQQLYERLGGTYDFDYMVGKRSSYVLSSNSCISELLTIDEDVIKKFDLSHLIRWFKLIGFLFSIRKKYDEVLILEKHWIFGLTFLLSSFKKRSGFDRAGKEGIFINSYKVFWDATKREVEYYLDFLKVFGLLPDYQKQKYSVGDLLSKEIPDNMRLILNGLSDVRCKGVIGISTGGGNSLSPAGDCRWWNISNWEKLTKYLLESGFCVVLLGANSDRAIDISSQSFFDLRGIFSLSEIIQFIERLDFVFCQESGFMHLTGSTSTPMIALAGPTNPKRFYPYNNNGEPSSGSWIWKMDYECYDLYGTYKNCAGDEMDKITVEDVISIFNTYL